MSRCDIQEGLNGSSESVVVKNDSNLDTSAVQVDPRALETYDLEVQKPSERAKIISDNAFFKKLSYSFYSESTRNSRSYSSLPKHYYLDLTSPKEQKASVQPTKSEPLSSAILNSLKSPQQHENKPHESMEQQHGTKAFKIKTLQNFYLPAGIPAPKTKLTSPLNTSKQKIDPTKIVEKKESPRKSSLKIESSPVKHENKQNISTTHLEILLKSVEKSPLSLAKTPQKVQSIEKSNQQRINEHNTNHHTDSPNIFDSSSSNMLSKFNSPKSTKLVLLPAGRVSDPKREEKAGPKTLRNNINALAVKDTASRLNQLITSRATLKKTNI